MFYLVLFVSLVSSIQCATYNILGVFMYPSIDDQIVFQTIWRELSLRGHHVTVLTPDPINDPALTNLTEINLGFAYDVLKKTKPKDVYFKNLNPYQYMREFHNHLDLIAEAELNSPPFKAILSDKTKKFDLILIDVIHPVMFALTHVLQAPIISISSAPVSNDIYDAVGNPNHPILYPDPILNFRPAHLTMSQKFRSISFFLWSKYQHHQVFVPRAHEMAKKHFGNDIPYLGDLERNVSMFFINVNLLLNIPRANVPAIIEIGTMIDEKLTTSLPKKLETVLDNAKKGVIYVDLGDNLKKFHFSKNVLQNMLNAFSELPYKFLLKWESDDVPTLPTNVIVRKSVPQRAVLAHRNVKLFITKGDQRSIEESVAEEVPMIGIPFVGYQPGSVRRAVELGIAARIDPDTLTKIKLKNKINKVLNTGSYKDAIKMIRDILFDKPLTGLESAVWWSEYVVRHDGARHLRSPAVDMPWYQYLLVDVISFLILCILTALYIIWKVLLQTAKYSKLLAVSLKKYAQGKKLKEN